MSSEADHRPCGTAVEVQEVQGGSLTSLTAIQTSNSHLVARQIYNGLVKITLTRGMKEIGSPKFIRTWVVERGGSVQNPILV
jgi:hypothetical protein